VPTPWNLAISIGLVGRSYNSISTAALQCDDNDKNSKSNALIRWQSHAFVFYIEHDHQSVFSSLRLLLTLQEGLSAYKNSHSSNSKCFYGILVGLGLSSNNHWKSLNWCRWIHTTPTVLYMRLDTDKNTGSWQTYGHIQTQAHCSYLH